MLFNKLSYFAGTLPIISFLLFYRRNKEGGYWVIFLYCILSFLADTSFHVPRINRNYSFYILAGLTITEYSLFSFFIYLSLKERLFKLILIVSSLLFYIIAAYNIVKNPGSFDSLGASMEASMLIFFCILYLFEQIKDPSIIYIYYSKNFWIVIAFLLYFSSTLFLFIYAGTLTKHQYHIYWRINNIFDILKNLLFTVSFVIKKNKHPEQPLESFYPDGN